MLTVHEGVLGHGNTVQEEPEQSNEEQAMLSAENSALDFSVLPTKVTGGAVIKILNGNKEEAIDNYVNYEGQSRSR